MSFEIADWPRTLTTDVLSSLLVGEYLGAGQGRQVYVCALNPRWVVKIEVGKQSFQNPLEWEAWQSLKDTAQARWFAPCVAISDCGMGLIQHRTKPVRKSQYPKRVPRFLGDLKWINFGWLRGRLVCHDYGYLADTGIGYVLTAGGNTYKADWWGPDPEIRP